MAKKYRKLASRLFRLLEEGNEDEVRERLSGYSPQTLLGLMQYSAAVEKGSRKLARRLGDVERRLVLDPKTGLFRYDVFEEDLLDIFSRKNFPFNRSIDREPVALIMGDLDDFTAVNNDYGHSSGDSVLYQMAGTIMDSVDGDGKVYRHGGEEIAILLPGMTSEEAAPVAENARKKLARHDFQVNKPPYKIKVTISLGVHHYPPTPGQFREFYRDREGLIAFYRTLKKGQKGEYEHLMRKFNGGKRIREMASDPKFQELYRLFMIDKLVTHADDALRASKHYGKNRVSVYNEVPQETLKILHQR